MDVAKVIRTLGYIVYTALWTPVILVFMVTIPVWVAVTCIRLGAPVQEGFKWLKQAFWGSIGHDVNFIKTGEW